MRLFWPWKLRCWRILTILKAGAYWALPMLRMMMIGRCVAISILCCYLVVLSAYYERISQGYNIFFSLLDDYKFSDSSAWGFYSKAGYVTVRGHFQFPWSTITVDRSVLLTVFRLLSVCEGELLLIHGFLWGVGNCIHGKSKGCWSFKLGGPACPWCQPHEWFVSSFSLLPSVGWLY